MKYAIITVAGMSKRFNENHDIAKLKCIYYEGDERSTLLYSILNRCEGIDKVIIVGGYQYEVLVDYINKFRREFSPSYAQKYGSKIKIYYKRKSVNDSGNKRACHYRRIRTDFFSRNGKHTSNDFCNENCSKKCQTHNG